jgi:hypothetical protein
LGRRAVLTNCVARGNTGASGFFKIGSAANELNVELVDCSAIDCGTGVQFTQTAVGTTPSFVKIRGGNFTSNDDNGISLTLQSNVAEVTVDGVVSSANGGIGLRIDPTFAGSWQDHGPIVVDNRIFGNASTAQILMGDATRDRIGGVCMGNSCRSGALSGNIVVIVSATYAMRGLSATLVTPWSEKPNNDSTVADNQPMAFNVAQWFKVLPP